MLTHKVKTEQRKRKTGFIKLSKSNKYKTPQTINENMNLNGYRIGRQCGSTFHALILSSIKFIQTKVLNISKIISVIIDCLFKLTVSGHSGLLGRFVL